MRKLLALWIALAAIAVASVPASAQGFNGGGFNVGLGPFASGAGSYQGPGDAVGGAQAYGSCARVYNAAAASTSTSLCDLVDSAAPATVICTLRGTTSGFVDLTAYCGGLTPSAKCAAATGGVCNVSQVYDQVGGNHWVNTTAATQPVLTFSALNGLPGLTGVAANGTVLTAPALVSGVAFPYVFVSVHQKTGSAASESALGVYGAGSSIGSGPSANTVGLYGATGVGFTVAATDGPGYYHSAIGLVNNTSSVLNVDGSETTGTTDLSGIGSGSNLRILRGNGVGSLDGTVMEVILYAATMGSSARSALNSNIHGANGFNF
jgi:hypothetical protein